MSELHEATVAELAARIRAKDVSPVEVTQAFIERADEVEPRIGAFITRTSELALQQAREAETEIAGGAYRGPFHGIPVGIKDIYWTAGVRTTSGSTIEAEFVPERDSGAVRRLREAGAVVLGKTNTVEFAFDPTGRNAHYGMPNNPWGLDRMPGGSSSGTGAGVAAGMMPLGLGSDTGGSIRIPSALCGLTGIKPTFGAVSRFGVTPLSYSLDTAGPMGRSAEDMALAMNVLAGYDPEDPASARFTPPDYAAGLNEGVRGMRIGVPREYVWDPVDPQVEAAFRSAMSVFEELGAEVVEVSIPELAWVPALAVAITTGEAAAVYGDRVLARGDEFDQSVRRRVETGLFLPAATYAKALRARVLLERRVAAHFARVDLIATPTVPVPAPRQGLETMAVGGTEINVREALLRLTRIFNLNRLPAVSVPAGFSGEGLPMAFQLAAPAFEDARTLRAAHAYQQVTDFHRARPAL